MSKLAHNDAPVADPLARKLYTMIRNQAPPEQVRHILYGEFNITYRLKTAPGYIQANGFATFKLGGLDGDQLLRLHFWPAGLPDEGDTSGMHDHVFHLTSLVLDGNGPMINTVYDVCPDKSSTLNLYEVEYTGPKTSRINTLGENFSGVAAKREIIPPSSYYTLGAGRFHTSRIAGDAEAITLLATSINPELSPRPRFLAASGGDSNYQRPELTNELRNRVIARLQNAYIAL